MSRPLKYNAKSGERTCAGDACFSSGNEFGTGPASHSLHNPFRCIKDSWL